MDSCNMGDEVRGPLESKVEEDGRLVRTEISQGGDCGDSFVVMGLEWRQGDCANGLSSLDLKMMISMGMMRNSFINNRSKGKALWIVCSDTKLMRDKE